MSRYTNPRTEAMFYLEQHNLFRLFEVLGSKLAHEKPEDPNTFLLEELKKIEDMRKKKQPVTLFTEADVSAMFSAFDITGRGFLTQSQYAKALNAVGVSQTTKPAPPGEIIDKKAFVAHIYAEVLQNSFK